MYNDATYIRSRRRGRGVSIMVHLLRRSLLLQLVGVYLLFVAIVLASGLEADAVGQQQLESQIQSTDLALAQEVAFDTYTDVDNVATSLIVLSRTVAGEVHDSAGMSAVFSAYKIARGDVDHIYWLDTTGALRVSVPSDPRTLGTRFASMPVFQQAENSNGPVVEGGSVDPTTSNKVMTIGEAVRDNRGQFMGVVATSLLLGELSSSLQIVIAAQPIQGQHLIIDILDNSGQLIASPERDGLELRFAASQIPGAQDAIAGRTAITQGPGPNGQTWLYSAVPVPAFGWAVVVQQPTSDLSAATTNFSAWLLLATGMFAVGGLIFWLVLMRRVVQPLHTLAERNATFPAKSGAPRIIGRADEIGGLARSLDRLNQDVATQLMELRTLLETSNAVVNSLDPQAVGRTIIREVRRLVDVQAAAVLVPDDTGTLRVLVSEGRAENYEDAVRVPPDRLAWPSARALHEKRPVQMIDEGKEDFPLVSASEGFRAILAIPIVSQRVGGVVLVVHRREPQPFTKNEVDLLLTFANYATLAWEHAVLYERSDERLREVAQENERLYRQAEAEKQTLSAIMGSISDGLLLTSMDGLVLYANPGARTLIGPSAAELEGANIASVHAELQAIASNPEHYERDRRRVEAGELTEWLLETRAGDRKGGQQAIALRLFDVRDEGGTPIGRGLLLRDVTRERELDQFKTTLLAAVGHELRTPLAAIKGHASTLLQEDVTWPVDDQRHFLRTISAEADQLAKLVSNLLDLSRLEAGLLSLHRRPRRLADLIDAAAHGIREETESLTLEIPDDLPLVNVDASRIEVVIHNLLVNGHKYGNGLVHLNASVQDGAVLVRVSDNGPGMSPEDVPHIFERFYRAQHARRQQVGGTGLGLAICKAFVEAHGGTIWADSDASGTTIAFTLPAAPIVGRSAQTDEAQSAYRRRTV